MTPGYVEALSIPLTDGRVFTTADTTSPVIAMLVNEMFARAYLNNGRPPVGRRFIGMLPNLLGRDDAVVHVVGVVDDVLLDSLDGQPQPQIYLPLGSVGVDLRRAATLVVKTDGEPEALVPLLTRTVQAIEPTAAVSRTGALTARVSASADEPRFFAFVITAFGILALSLATAGLYGVLSYSYGQRRREFGVRAALGATRGGLVRIVLREGVTITAVGLVLGIGLAAVLARGMAGILFGVAPLDGVAFVAGPAVLLVMAVAACLAVARRVTSFGVSETLAGECFGHAERRDPPRHCQTRRDGHHEQYRRPRHERHTVERRHTEQDAGHASREHRRQADPENEADGGDGHAFTEHDADESAACRSKRGADTELAPALPVAVREHAIESRRRERQGQDAERRDDEREEPRLIRGCRHARRQRPCAADRGGWLDRLHGAREEGYESLGLTVRLHHERRGTPQVDADRAEGQVDLRLRLPVEAVEQHVVDDAHHVDHGIVPAEQVGQHPDETASHWRTAVVQIRPREHLVHQHRDHRRGRIRRREDATIGERDAQRLDITRGHDARRVRARRAARRQPSPRPAS